MKNLHKLISVFFILLAISSNIGCSSKSTDNYKTFIESIPNDGTISKSETDFWDGVYFQSSSCAKEYECDVLSYSLKGEYNKSLTYRYNSYITNYYTCETGVQFGIRDDNNQLVLLNLMTKDFFETEPYLEDIDNSEEYCRSYASEIAEYFIKDINKYQMTLKSKTKNTEKDGESYSITYYFFTFYKSIAGYNSSDCITVKMTSKGHLASVFIGDTYAFDDQSFQIDEEVFRQALNEKVIDVYSSTDYKILDFSIQHQYIVKAPDGCFYIASRVKVELLDNSGTQFDTLIGLISLLE